MDAQDYLRVMRKRWKTIAAVTLLTTIIAALVSFLTPKTYQATSEMYVSTTGASSSADLASGSTFMSKQIKTYADVVTSPIVLDPVRKQLGVAPGRDVAGKLTATVPPDTMLIDLGVTDRDPVRAAKVANLISKQFTETVGDLQASGNKQQSPVKVTVVSPATIPDHPVSPRPLRNLALGLVAGLLLGLGLALLREILDTTVKSEADVTALTDSTIIGGIAFDPDATAHPLTIQGDPHSTRAEAFRSLRTNLQFIDAANRPRVMVFTSSLPGEGKSTTTANLALAIGEQGSTVCVVEGDLRRPKLLEYMGLESGVGLTSVLIGEAELDDVLQPFAENVTVLGCGPVPPNPSELLGSQPMAKVLERLRERFDYVIIDAPPLLPVTDAAVVSRLADGVVLVVGNGLIKREHVTRALHSLETVGATILGVVLNRVPTKGVDSYGYYGGYYGYRPRSEDRGAERTGRSQHRGSGASVARIARRAGDDEVPATPVVEQSAQEEPTEGFSELFERAAR